MYTYKLRGLPWLSYDRAQVVSGREVICRLLTALNGAGYELVANVDMAIGNDSRDGALFVLQQVCSSVECDAHAMVPQAIR